MKRNPKVNFSKETNTNLSKDTRKDKKADLKLTENRALKIHKTKKYLSINIQNKAVDIFVK